MTGKFENSRCEMADGIVSYMYREMTSADRSGFEAHLASCEACIDEFAEIADARFSVYEWRKIEFDAIPTPQFVIPFGDAVQATWVGRIRKKLDFASGWAIGGISTAAASVLLALAFVGYQSQSGSDVAGNIQDVDRTELNQVRPTNVDAVDETKTGNMMTVDELRKPYIKTDARNNDRRSVPVKVSRPTAADRRTRLVRPASQPARTVERQPPTQLPTFVEYAEQEDETLRLAELFDDIDTSE